MKNEEKHQNLKKIKKKSLQNIYFKMVNFINQIKLYFNR